jgi:hypothetical protein
LVTLLVSLFATVGVVGHVVEIVYPDPYSVPFLTQPVCAGSEKCAEDTIMAEERQARSQRRYAVLGIVRSLTTMLVSMPVYLYHWRRVQRDRGLRRGQAPLTPSS